MLRSSFVCKVLGEPGPRVREKGIQNGQLCEVCLDKLWRKRCHSRAHPTWCCVRLHGVLLAGFGEGLGDCRDAAVTQKVVLLRSFGWCFLGRRGRGRKLFPFGRNMVSSFSMLLSILVTVGEPTLVHDVFSSVGFLRAFLGKYGQNRIHYIA